MVEALRSLFFFFFVLGGGIVEAGKAQENLPKTLRYQGRVPFPDAADEGMKGFARLHILLQPVPNYLFVDHRHFQIGNGKSVGDGCVDLLPLVGFQVTAVEKETPCHIRAGSYLRVDDVDSYLPPHLLSLKQALNSFPAVPFVQLQRFLDHPVAAGVHPVGQKSILDVSEIAHETPGIVDDGIAAKQVSVVPLTNAVQSGFLPEIGGHFFHFGFRESKAIFHGVAQHGGHRRVVEVAEDALLGHFEYADDHRLLQIGVVPLHHEAADEGDHFIVKIVGVGGVQRGVVLVQKDVDWVAVGTLEPYRQKDYGFLAVLIAAFFVQYFGKQLFFGIAQHSTILQILMSLVFCGEHVPDKSHAILICRFFHVLET